MGLFDLFRKRNTIQDEVFGKLHVMTFKDASQNFFTGKGIFMPTDTEIEYSVMADSPDGPTVRQKEFYKNFQRNFDYYVEKVKPLILDEFRNWKEDFDITDFKKEFPLIAMVIPSLATTNPAWEISFSTIHDADHEFTIEFLSDDPQGVAING